MLLCLAVLEASLLLWDYVAFILEESAGLGCCSQGRWQMDVHVISRTDVLHPRVAQTYRLQALSSKAYWTLGSHLLQKEEDQIPWVLRGLRPTSRDTSCPLQ